MCLCKGRRGSVPRRVWCAGAPFLGRVCLVCVCGILLMVAQHCTQLSPLALKHKKRTNLSPFTKDFRGGKQVDESIGQFFIALP